VCVSLSLRNKEFWLDKHREIISVLPRRDGLGRSGTEFVVVTEDNGFDLSSNITSSPIEPLM